ncbi:ABC transporter substrate-binding protein [Oscillibacter sp.]|uniref:ABC transporter substrate-binding protein n=1 Tax=Oscillibacter sp. TaxID=1945593 RepID=UPI00261E4C01|nr:ABC transporter substrate-binding protein [Oscillibacter sp.]MDD3347422.1 ABC transporter substrate-binding protein [Oscillibacter sp.]
MNRHFLKVLLSFSLAAVLLTGCWQEAPPEVEGLTPVQSGQSAPQTTETRSILPKVFALPYAPDQSLDPVSCPDGMQQTVSSLLYEGLFRLNEALEPEAWLCQQYTYDSAAYVYTFVLKSGITFSDGAPLTAADVKATLDRARSAERYRARFAGIVSISAAGNTVTISLSGPNTGFPALLDVPIVKAGTEKDAAPVGTGPYLFSVSDGRAYLVANQSWWRGGRQPIDRIALVEAADRDTMLYRFTSHDVQLITADLIGTSSISATGNTSYLDADTTTLLYIGCNTTRAPLDNAAFRQALWKGFNRSYVVSAFLSGHGAAAQFPVSPRSSLYPVSLEARYSADDFAAALTASGYTPSHTLTLLVNEENSFKVSVAEYLSSFLTAAGVPVKVSALPWEAYAAALSAGNFDLYFGEVKLTADWNLAGLLSTGGALNYGRWSNPQTDQLLLALSAATDRAAAMEALCTHLRAQSPILPVCFKSASVLMQTDVLDGLTPTMAEPFYNLSECVIHLQAE